MNLGIKILENEVDCPLHGKNKVTTLCFGDESKDQILARLNSCPICEKERNDAYFQKEKEQEDKRKEYAISMLIKNTVYKDNVNAEFSEIKKGNDEIKQAIFKLCKKEIYCIVIVGKEGRGKTYCSVACMREFLRKNYYAGIDCIYTTLVDMCDESKLTFGKSIPKYKFTDFLIIDEMGKDKNSEYNLSLLSSILDYRLCNYLPTILLSNLTPEELIDRYFDNSTMSRITRNGILINKKGEDYRNEKRDY